MENSQFSVKQLVMRKRNTCQRPLKKFRNSESGQNPNCKLALPKVNPRNRQRRLFWKVESLAWFMLEKIWDRQLLIRLWNRVLFNLSNLVQLSKLGPVFPNNSFSYWRLPFVGNGGPTPPNTFTSLAASRRQSRHVAATRCGNGCQVCYRRADGGRRVVGRELIIILRICNFVALFLTNNSNVWYTNS